MAINTPSRSVLRPVLATTTTSADFSLRFPPSPFQARGEISPGKNAPLPCTTAGFTPHRLDHKSFAVSCPLALLSTAFYPVLVHRLAVSLHASSPRSVALPQLRFASFTVVSSRQDLHLQGCAHAGRTKKQPTANDGLQTTSLCGTWRSQQRHQARTMPDTTPDTAHGAHTPHWQKHAPAKASANCQCGRTGAPAVLRQALRRGHYALQCQARGRRAAAGRQ